MIEQKIVVGRYLELTTPPPVLTGPPVNGFQGVSHVVLNIAESESSAAPVAPNNPMVGFNPTLTQKVQIGAQRARQQLASQFDRQRVSATGVGQVAKVHRNFVWLEWLGGLVSEVAPNGMDVLTGPMSGCWITEYMRGGVRYIGHVGTVMTATDPASIAARTAWNNFAAGKTLGTRSGFNPFNDPWMGAEPAGLPGEAARKTFALVTGDGKFYTVITYPQLNKPNRIRIAGIQQRTNSLPIDGQI